MSSLFLSKLPTTFAVKHFFSYAENTLEIKMSHLFYLYSAKQKESSILVNTKTTKQTKNKPSYIMMTELIYSDLRLVLRKL